MGRALLAAVFSVTLAFFAPHAAGEEIEVEINMQRRHQRIEGFGTCLIGWREDFRRLYRTEEFQKYYVQEMGFNFLRTEIHHSFLDGRPVENWEDIRWQDFDLHGANGRNYVFLEFVRGIRELNPEIRVISSVWSPPAWMKVNKAYNRGDPPHGSINAHTDYEIRGRDGERSENRVDPKYFKHFAMYLVEFARLLQHETGVRLYALSIGNEVMFSQSFASCQWNAADYAEMTRILGEMLEENDLGDVKLFGPETMTSHNFRGGNPEYIRALMGDPEVARHFDVFATHGYEDGVIEDFSATGLARFRELTAPYGRPFWITEGGTGGHDWPEPLHNIAAATHNTLVHGNVNAYVPWQITDRRPMTHNMMVYDEPTKKTYAMQHYSRFIDEGAYRINASPAESAVRTSAYLHQWTGALTVVIINPTEEEQDVTLRFIQAPPMSELNLYRTTAEEDLVQLAPVPIDDNRRAVLALPAESIVTLTNQ